MKFNIKTLPWDTYMLAGFAFAIPLMVLEFLRPGLVTRFVPLQMFALPFVFIVPAAFQEDPAGEDATHTDTENHQMFSI